jgi:hypothetical protein
MGEGRPRTPPSAALAGAPALVLRAAPLAAVLLLLAPYLWPLDRAPTSSFSDIRQYHAPMAELLAAGLRRDGELPRWNVQDFAGMPTLGDPQTQMFNPLHWPLLWRPSLHAFGPLIVAYTLAGALGFLAYAHALGLSAPGAAAGAVAFTLGGKLLLHLVLPGHTVFAPFFLIPWLLWSLERAIHRAGPGWIAGGAILTGLLAVSLHPQLLFYSAALVATVSVARARHAPRARRALAAVAAAAVLGTALAGVHLLPMAMLASEFSRGQAALFDATRVTEDLAAAEEHLGPGERWPADMISGHEPPPDWEILGCEGRYYVGGVGFALAMVGLLAWPRRDPRRRLAWLFGVTALVLLLFGLGTRGGVEPWLRGLPGFAFFRIPARALVLLGFPVALVIALGVEALERAPARRARLVAAAAAALALAALWASDAAGAHFATVLATVAGAVLLAGPGRRRRGAGALLVVAAVAVDAALIVAPHVATAPETTMGRLPQGLVLPADIAATVRFAEFDRRGGAPVVPQLEVRRRGLERLAGYNPLIPWRFVLYASYAGGFDPFQQRFDMVAVPIPARARPVLFDLLGVSYLLHPPVVAGGMWRWERSTEAFPRAYLAPGPVLVPEGEGTARLASEQDALARLAALDPRAQVLLHGRAAESALAAIGADDGRAFEPYRPVPLASRTANRLALEVQLAQPGILVLNEPFFPGWQARDGGREVPLLRANVLFRALVLGPGEHRIELEFAPISWRIGRWITVAAALTTLALAGLALGRAVTARRRA